MIDFKSMYLRMLFTLPHNNIFEFHHLSLNPEIELSDRKITTENFYKFIESHKHYLPLETVLLSPHCNVSAITFDDGLEDLYTIAYPYLTEQKIPFTAFILADKLDEKGYITTLQLKEMVENSLVTIGSHGLSHISLNGDTENQWKEIKESKDKLEFITGKPCKYIAYPRGTYNKTTLELVEKAEYQYGFAVKGRPLYKDFKRYEVPRLSIHEGTIEKYWKA